jgi:hypothetical protein
MQNNNNTNKYIPKNQMQSILDNRPKDVDGKELINKLIQNGYTIEGIEKTAPATTEKPLADKLKDRVSQITGGVQDIGKGGAEIINNIKTGSTTDTGSDIKGGANIVNGIVGGGLDIFGAGLNLLGLDKVVQKGVEALPASTQQGLATGIDYLQNKLNENAPEGTPRRAVVDAVGNLLQVFPIGKASQIVKGGVESTMKKVGESVADNVIKKSVQAVPEAASGMFNNIYSKVVNTDLGEKLVAKPFSGLDESQLFELRKPAQKIKNVEEALSYAAKSFENKSLPSVFTQAGDRFGKAIEDVISLKKGIGAKMGSIEDTLGKTAEILSFNADKVGESISKYGLKLTKDGVAPVNPLLKEVSGLDYNKIGSAINASMKALEDGDVKTIREIASHLKTVARDNFDEVLGKYTDRTYQVVYDIAKNLDSQVNEQVLANLPKKSSKVYKGLMEQYAKYSEVADNALKLVGKDGVEGTSIRAGSVAKALSQSIHQQSEAVRQIANFVREKTGYDFFKDANNADLLMQAVGDFRGQSINRALNNVVSTGGTSVIDLAKKIVEMTGITSKEKNIEALLKKYNPEVVAKEGAKATKKAADVVFKEGGIYTIPEKQKIYQDVIKPQLDKIGDIKPDETIIYYSGDGKAGQYVNTNLDEVWGYNADNLKVKKVKTSSLDTTGDAGKDGVGYRIIKKKTSKKGQ